VLRAGEQPADGELHVAGTVAEIVYAGSETRIVVDTVLGQALSALELNAAVGRHDLQRGDKVTLTWPPEASRVLAR
jgi:putative spermidine/putrescine transport system ATP-binding protein